MNKTDLALIIADGASANQDFSFEQDIIQLIQKKEIPYLIILNKQDMWKEHETEYTTLGDICVSAVTGYHINELKTKIASSIPAQDEKLRIVGDLIQPGDFIVLVVPIDKAAPKGLSLIHIFAAIEIPKKKTYKNLYFVLTAIAVIIASINMSQNAKSMIDGLDQEFHYSDLKSYTEFIKSTKPLIASIQKKDSGFYRIEKNYEYSKNDAMLLGYHGMTHYSSTYNAYVNETTRQLGLAQTWFWNSGYGSTPVLDSIFDVKYILFNQQVPNLYNKLTTNEYNITAYENPDVLPIAFAAGHKKNPVFSADDPFQNQNNLLNCLAETNQNYFYPVVFNKTNRAVSYTHLDVYKRQPSSITLILCFP